MKVLFFFVFLLASFVSFGQNKGLTKKQLLDVINVTINQKAHLNTEANENGFYGQWYSNNEDNAFLTSDTLKLYNSKNVMEDSIYKCLYKILEFSKGNKFSQRSFNKCADPRMTQAETDARNNIGMDKESKKKFDKLIKGYVPQQYKIVEKSSDVFLMLHSENRVLYSFKLYDVSNYNDYKLGKDSYVITLVRQKLN
jgi:hypothetical protein